MNQGKLDVVKQEMARVNINIIGISELKWMGMGDFNLDDHYTYYCRQEYWSGLPEQRALTNISRKNEEAGSKQKQCSAVDVYGAESKVQCCKEKRCIGNLDP